MSEWKYKVVDVADDSTTINSEPTLFKAVYINTVLSNHALIIKDDTSSVLTIPAQAAAGKFYDFYGLRFETSLVVDPDDSATGSITMIYRDL